MLSKSKIKDSKKPEKDFKYKMIIHNENDIDCLHCKYEEREK